MNQNTIDYQIKSTWHGIFKMYNQVAAKHGSTQAAGYFLLTISKEGTPATSIAPLMGMEATSMSRIIKSMENKGLIFRKQDEKDKRMVRIFLTPEGEKISMDCNLCHTITAQGTPGEMEFAQAGSTLEFVHPDGDEDWKD